MSKACRPWSGAQLRLLRKLYPDTPTARIARRLRRKISHVYAKAAELGVRKSDAFFNSGKSGRITNGRVLFGRKWTRAEVGTLTRLYPDTLTADIAAKLERPAVQVWAKAKKLWLKKSAAFLASEKSGRLRKGSTIGASSRFAKGHVPWTKGRKGLQIGGRETQFKPGQRAHNRMPVGTIVMASNGYLRVKVGEPKAWRWVHRMVWEELRGHVPSGMLLVFKDGNHENVEIENLKLVTRQEHMRRHSIHRYPDELKDVIRLQALLKRQIERRAPGAAK